MIVTEFSQNQHPELNLKVTQVSQDIIVGNFKDWYKEIERINNHKNALNCQAHMVLRKYFKLGLSPLVAFNMYFNQ